MSSPEYRKLLSGEIESEEYVEIVKRDVDEQLAGGHLHAVDAVWIPSVPLPFMGLFSERCMCGERFRGKDRRSKYELHFRRVHEQFVNVGMAQMCVTREEAERIYREVRAV